LKGAPYTLPGSIFIDKAAGNPDMFWIGEVFMVFISSQEGLSSPIWAL
jgi:hypothetical protein